VREREKRERERGRDRRERDREKREERKRERGSVTSLVDLLLFWASFETNCYLGIWSTWAFLSLCCFTLAEIDKRVF